MARGSRSGLVSNRTTFARPEWRGSSGARPGGKRAPAQLETGSFSVAFRPGAPLSPATAPGGLAGPPGGTRSRRRRPPTLGQEFGQQRLMHVGAVLGGDLAGIVQHQGAGSSVRITRRLPARSSLFPACSGNAGHAVVRSPAVGRRLKSAAAGREVNSGPWSRSSAIRPDPACSPRLSHGRPAASARTRVRHGDFRRAALPVGRQQPVARARPTALH